MSPEKVKMKGDLHSRYHGLGCEEEFGTCEELSFQQKKRWIDTRVIINVSKHSERLKRFGKDGDLGTLFYFFYFL